MQTNSPETIDEYISNFPPEIQDSLQKIRTTIHEAAPGAKEKISYGIPTFTLHGNLVHYAAYESHYGFYPTPSGVAAFQSELTPYDISKGTVKFPLNKPVPYDLITKIVTFRAQENLAKKG